MPTESEYEYMESRLGAPVSRTHQFSIEGAKLYGFPTFWISRGSGDGSHWSVTKYMSEYYVSKTMGSAYDKPVPIFFEREKRD